MPTSIVAYPSYPPSSVEKASRSVAIHDLEDLVSGDVESKWLGGEVLLETLTARFRQPKEMTATFYTPHQAEKACQLLAARLRR